ARTFPQQLRGDCTSSSLLVAQRIEIGSSREQSFTVFRPLADNNVSPVFEYGMFGPKPASTSVKLTGQPIGVNKCFQNGDVSVLIGVRISCFQRVNKESRKPGSVCFLAAFGCCNNNPSFS